MVLIDSLYINNSGGKVLLDYLIEELEKTDIPIFYLLDERVRDNHPKILKNKIVYLKASFFSRHCFYLKNRNKFSKVFCFGNLPPSVRCHTPVYTYFQQRLYLDAPENLSVKKTFLLNVKSAIVKFIKGNTNFWIVQSAPMKKELMDKFSIDRNEKVLVVPFYPPLTITSDLVIERNRNSFVYVSGGAPHKNHLLLLKAFVAFYDKHKTGELHLTINKSEATQLFLHINTLITKGYPIINYGIIERRQLSGVYRVCEYAIYPSLIESFGLGIVEAIESGCKIIGADLPYLHAVCEPSVVFDPYSVESITNALEKAAFSDTKPSKQILFNKVDELIDLLK